MKLRHILLLSLITCIACKDEVRFADYYAGHKEDMFRIKTIGDSLRSRYTFHHLSLSGRKEHVRIAVSYDSIHDLKADYNPDTRRIELPRHLPAGLPDSFEQAGYLRLLKDSLLYTFIREYRDQSATGIVINRHGVFFALGSALQTSLVTPLMGGVIITHDTAQQHWYRKALDHQVYLADAQIP